MPVETLLRGALPPIVAALVLVGLGGRRLLPLAVAVGLFAAHGLLDHAWPPLPHELWNAPVGADWLMWSIVAASMVALLEHVGALRRRAAVVVGLGVACAAVGLTLAKVAARWSIGEVALHVGAGGLAAALAVLGARALVARAGDGPASAVWFAAVLSVEAALVALYSAFLGQLAGAVATALGAAAATAFWRRGFALRRADGAWLGVAHALPLLAARHLGELGWLPMAAAFVGPFAPLLLPDRLRERPWRWLALAAPLGIGPGAAALWLTWPEPGAYGY